MANLELNVFNKMHCGRFQNSINLICNKRNSPMCRPNLFRLMFNPNEVVK